MSVLSATARNSRAWRQRRKFLTEAVLTLYTSSAPISQLDAAFTAFHPQLTFQDPIVRVTGIDQYEAQFRALRDIFTAYKPISVDITGDFDKISMDVTVEWRIRWWRLKLRQVTLCHISDGGMGVIERHEDCWSWADVWMQLPLFGSLYAWWRPVFGTRLSQILINRAEKKGEHWVGRARQTAATPYTGATISQGPAQGEEEDGEDGGHGPVTSTTTQRTIVSSSRQ